MFDSPTGKLNYYLFHFEKQYEAGLLVIDNSELKNELCGMLEMNGFSRSTNWRQALERLGENKSAYLMVDGRMSKEQYDLLAQYQARGGMIQIMDRETMELEKVEFDPTRAHLLLVSDTAGLEDAERTHSIRDKVSLTEHFG